MTRAIAFGAALACLPYFAGELIGRAGLNPFTTEPAANTPAGAGNSDPPQGERREPNKPPLSYS